MCEGFERSLECAWLDLSVCCEDLGEPLPKDPKCLSRSPSSDNLFDPLNSPSRVCPIRFFVYQLHACVYIVVVSMLSVCLLGFFVGVVVMCMFVRISVCGVGTSPISPLIVTLPSCQSPNRFHKVCRGYLSRVH